MNTAATSQGHCCWFCSPMQNGLEHVLFFQRQPNIHGNMTFYITDQYKTNLVYTIKSQFEQSCDSIHVQLKINLDQLTDWCACGIETDKIPTKIV